MSERPVIRKCPRCTFPLDVKILDNVELDYCRRCNGTFLDPGEGMEIFGPFVSPDVWKQSVTVQEHKKSRLKCPEDNSPFIMYHVRFGGKGVSIDLCPKCSGMWLDPGEGKKLRDVVMEAGQSKESDIHVSEPGVASYLFQLMSGLPIEVWNPRRRFPLATITIISILYVVFLIQLITGNGGNQIGFIGMFGLLPSEILHGERLWTIVTSAFLHGGLIHILGNTYFLYVFGDNVEDFLGKKRFLFLYGASAIAGAMLQAVFQSDPMIPMIGASGAIAGLMGAYIVLFSRIKLYVVWFFVRFRLGVLWYLGIWMVYNVSMVYNEGEGVAWMAHIGGFMMGTIIAFLYKPEPLTRQLLK